MEVIQGYWDAVCGVARQVVVKRVLVFFEKSSYDFTFRDFFEVAISRNLKPKQAPVGLLY